MVSGVVYLSDSFGDSKLTRFSRAGIVSFSPLYSQCPSRWSTYRRYSVTLTQDQIANMHLHSNFNPRFLTPYLDTFQPGYFPCLIVLFLKNTFHHHYCWCYLITIFKCMVTFCCLPVSREGHVFRWSINTLLEGICACIKRKLCKNLFSLMLFIVFRFLCVFIKYLEILSRKFYLNKWFRIGKENWELSFGGFGKKIGNLIRMQQLVKV